MEAIIVTNLERTFRTAAGDVRALRGVNLRVNAGEWVGVRGRSGSGKTTLLNCIGGLDRPTSGSLVCFGRDMTVLSDAELTEWRRREVAFVFQSFALMPTLSALENVELPLQIANMTKTRQRAKECLEMVEMGRWSDHRPPEMSGGQQQRVAIARALSNRPRLLIADEPTGELDTHTSRDILKLLRKIVREEKVTLLMSSHDPLALEHADRVLELKDGALVNPVVETI
jgi:ABC-type lipoprotein export system ATPase subunit